MDDGKTQLLNHANLTPCNLVDRSSNPGFSSISINPYKKIYILKIQTSGYPLMRCPYLGYILNTCSPHLAIDISEHIFPHLSKICETDK